MFKLNVDILKLNKSSLDELKRRGSTSANTLRKVKGKSRPNLSTKNERA